MTRLAAFVYDDGGRAAAGFQGVTGDCVVRAIAIACQLDYRDVYDELHRRAGKSPRSGVHRAVYQPFLAGLGWRWVPTMSIGSGTTVHLRHDELPGGRIIARCTRHLVAVIDGDGHDIGDPTRGGTRAVYGYFTEA